MCGICGMIGFRWKAFEGVNNIDKMLDRIHHRGPDDFGVCGVDVRNTLISGRSIKDVNKSGLSGALGFKRLSIQDISDAGHQPMLSDDRKKVITFNGEIYNVNELREELARNHNLRYRGHSDTEVIMHLYEAYGFDEMIHRLNGMFAIVLYDAIKHTLYIARDRYGIIPLHTIINDGFVAWSSEIKAFLEFVSLERKINEQGIYRSFMYPFQTDGMLEGVTALEPGTYYEFDIENGKRTVVQFYDINTNIGKEINSGDLIGEFERVLAEGVRRQLISDVPVGVQFSGGVDSTLLAKYVSDEFQKNRTQLYAFSLVNRGRPEFSEEQWIDHAASKISVNLNKFDMNESEFLSCFENVLYSYERFIFLPSPMDIYLISKSAKNHVTVFISGEGADEVAGGYSTFSSYRFYSHLGNIYFLNQKKKILENTLGKDEFLEGFDRQVDRTSCNALLPGFDDGGLLEERRAYYNKLLGSPFDKVRKLYFKYELVGLLERQNKVCMANSIENRVPFLDNEVADFLFRVPDDALLRGSMMNVIESRRPSKTYKGKYLVKQLSEKHYGSRFAFRDKQMVRVPIREYLRGDMFTQYAKEKIFSRMRQRDIVNMKYFDEKYQNMKDDKDAVIVWKAINFELWCQLFLDKRMPVSYGI